MKRIIKRIFSLCVTTLLVTCLGCVMACAQGSCDLQISPKNAGVGERINVTIEFSTVNMDVDSASCVVKYDPEIMEIHEDSPTQGSGGSIEIFKMAGDAPVVKIDLVFVAKKQGSAKLSVENTSILNFAGENIGSPTAESEIKIGADSGLDSDSKMKALEVSKGTLSPAFSPDVTNYKVDVANDVLDIEISGQMRSVKSTIHFAGGFSDIEGIDGTSPKIYKGKVNLNKGDNVRTIKITAENGEETVYTINVVRHADGEIIPINPEEKPVVSEKPEEEDPEETMNIFQTNTPSTTKTTVTNKSPKDDNIFEKLLPVLLILTFVIAGLLIVIVAFAVIQSRKEKQKKARRRAQRTQQSTSSKPRQSQQTQRPRQQSKSTSKTTVKRKKPNNPNIKRPK